jgi:hypothetical protein
MKKITKLAGMLVLALTINSSYSALTITGSSANTYNFALSNGNVLPDGGVFQIGYYSSALSTSYFSGLTTASSFATGWTSLASSTENFFGASGMRTVSVLLETGVNTHEGKILTMLVGNAGTISGSSEVGVFSNSSWIIPANPTGITPGDFGADIFDGGTVAYFGSLSLGTGAYPSEGVVNSAQLAAVIPEPSSASLLAIGVAGLVALRVRRKS